MYKLLEFLHRLLYEGAKARVQLHYHSVQKVSNSEVLRVLKLFKCSLNE